MTFQGKRMQKLMPSGNVTDHDPAQFMARERYFELRDRLVRLQSADEPSMPAIDALIQELESAQLAYKASHGLIGNNPIEP
jgi:hypothetical protein